MPQQKDVLFITRGQPGLHIGHLSALQQYIQESKADLISLTIGIGSANEEGTAKNPFTFTEREGMIKSSLGALLSDRIKVSIFPIPDSGDDVKRKDYILKNIHFDTIVTGNPHVQNIFRQEGKDIFVPELQEIVKATTIREILTAGKYEDLQGFLLPETIAYLQKIHADERMKKIMPYQQRPISSLSPQEIADYLHENNLLPDILRLLEQTIQKNVIEPFLSKNEHGREPTTPKVTADIITLYNNKLVLIKRKHFPFGYALPGGFVDVGESIPNAAIREAKEEISVDIRVVKELPVRSDPKRDPRGHNVANPFLCEIVHGEPKAADDAAEIILVEPTKEGIDTIAFAFPDHKGMIIEALGIE